MSKISDRSISISVILSGVLLLSFLFLSSPPLHAQSLNLTIGNYQLVNSKRISIYVWEYTYTAAVTNVSMGAAWGVSATVVSLVPTTKVIDNTLYFGNVPAYATQTSTDTFALQIDRRYPLKNSDLNWTINNAPCTPPDDCHYVSSWDPINGCIFADYRTTLNITETLQRFNWWRDDGMVDLYNDWNCTPWKERWVQEDEPPDTKNYCGPTAAMNLLYWYGSPIGYFINDYYQLGSEMHTNNWMSVGDALESCACFCSPCPWCLCPESFYCLPACTVIADGFFDVGTHPDDMESTLKKHSPLGNSVGYILHRRQGNPGIETFEWLLAKGNPIVVLIWNGSTLHWTLVTGIYRETLYDATKVRLANNGTLNWDYGPYWNFVSQWSFEDLSGPKKDALGHFGIKPNVWMYYEKTTILRGGPEEAGGFWIGESILSEDGRFRLVLQDDNNLVLYDNNGNALWASNTVGSDAQVLWMETGGNLVLRNSANAVVWQSYSHKGTGLYYLAVQNDGNVVIYNANQQAIWATDTCCH